MYVLHTSYNPRNIFRLRKDTVSCSKVPKDRHAPVCSLYCSYSCKQLGIATAKVVGMCTSDEDVKLEVCMKKVHVFINPREMLGLFIFPFFLIWYTVCIYPNTVGK